MTSLTDGICPKCKAGGGVTGPHPAGCTPQTRFWAKVRIAGKCWEWQGATNGAGYGMFRMGGGVRYLAHRYAYEQTWGDLEPNRVVMHRCDNPRCVRPAHLVLGTYSDNTRDAVAKGRLRPSRHNARKTVCPAGHAYDDTNTYRDRDGNRSCRACHREQERARKQRLREAA